LWGLIATDQPLHFSPARPTVLDRFRLAARIADG
jgi:hypothetical protein